MFLFMFSNRVQNGHNRYLCLRNQNISPKKSANSKGIEKKSVTLVYGSISSHSNLKSVRCPVNWSSVNQGSTQLVIRIWIIPDKNALFFQNSFEDFYTVSTFYNKKAANENFSSFRSEIEQRRHRVWNAF